MYAGVHESSRTLSFVDSAYPGRGGHAIHRLCNPLGDGKEIDRFGIDKNPLFFKAACNSKELLLLDPGSGDYCRLSTRND